MLYAPDSSVMPSATLLSKGNILQYILSSLIYIGNYGTDEANVPKLDKISNIFIKFCHNLYKTDPSPGPGQMSALCQ